MSTTKRKTPKLLSRQVQYNFGYKVLGYTPQQLADGYGVQTATVVRNLKKVRAYNVAIRAKGNNMKALTLMVESQMLRYNEHVYMLNNSADYRYSYFNAR